MASSANSEVQCKNTYMAQQAYHEQSQKFA